MRQGRNWSGLMNKRQKGEQTVKAQQRHHPYSQRSFKDGLVFAAFLQSSFVKFPSWADIFWTFVLFSTLTEIDLWVFTTLSLWQRGRPSCPRTFDLFAPSDTSCHFFISCLSNFLLCSAWLLSAICMRQLLFSWKKINYKMLFDILVLSLCFCFFSYRWKPWTN